MSSQPTGKLMITLFMTLIMVSGSVHQVIITTFPTLERCEQVAGLLRQGEPPVRGQGQRFECKEKE